ncbi:MAG TPA: hypothetical protein VFV95_02285 [Vicinamibacterales bacterium]|nr:hypothetical protein [Vicinamibacterales bacterium]
MSRLPDSVPATLAALRRLLLFTLLIGTIGMGTELLFIGHVEGAFQLTPVALLAAGFFVTCWCAVVPGRVAARAVQALMILFLISGLLGVGLHVRGNVEFARETYPDMSRAELVRRTVTGATPVLAPGSMLLLGLVGLAFMYHHPSLAAGGGHHDEERSS